MTIYISWECFMSNQTNVSCSLVWCTLHFPIFRERENKRERERERDLCWPNRWQLCFQKGKKKKKREKKIKFQLVETYRNIDQKHFQKNIAIVIRILREKWKILHVCFFISVTTKIEMVGWYSVFFVSLKQGANVSILLSYMHISGLSMVSVVCFCLLCSEP